MDGVTKHAVHTETRLQPRPHPLSYISNSSSSPIFVHTQGYTSYEQLCSSAVLYVSNSLFLYGEEQHLPCPRAMPRVGNVLPASHFGINIMTLSITGLITLDPPRMTSQYQPASESLCVLAVEFKHILTRNPGTGECNLNHFSITGFWGRMIKCKCNSKIYSAGISFPYALVTCSNPRYVLFSYHYFKRLCFSLSFWNWNLFVWCLSAIRNKTNHILFWDEISVTCGRFMNKLCLAIRPCSGN